MVQCQTATVGGCGGVLKNVHTFFLSLDLTKKRKDGKTKLQKIVKRQSYPLMTGENIAVRNQVQIQPNLQGTSPRGIPMVH
jgi:hypothetical protein